MSLISSWRRRALAGAAGLVAVAAVFVAGSPALAHHRGGDNRVAQHVLLLSVDGLHQSDLAWYIQQYPNSNLAALVAHGSEFTQAQTPFPSDSFPGMVAQMTGGNPKTTGVYYDDTWNAALLPAGTTNCAGAKPGVEVTYFEALDKKPLALDAGQGLSGLPNSILGMTGNPTTLIDPTKLPVDPKTCTAVYPHQYLRVNTIFEVARSAGLGTAWSDKHPAYEILDGPSGTGVQDLFAPEINSQASVAGKDWTTDNALTQLYDSYKVQSVLNEIRGYDHSGTTKVGMPAIFGMNFQTVSTAEKLPSGGYNADLTPSPLLVGALNYIDAQLGSMVSTLRQQGELEHTVIILSAKHGQSPIDPSKLTRIDDGPIVDALNAAWTAAGHTGKLVAFTIDDDGVLMWLNDRSQAAADFAKTFLLGHGGTGTDVTGASKPYTASGLTTVYAGSAAAKYIGVSPTDTVGMSRVPDVIGIAQVGSVYTGGTAKIAEHGGANADDRDVPLVVAGPMITPSVQTNPVETTQIAPTILKLLGLDPNALQAVQIEHTQVLPGS